MQDRTIRALSIVLRNLDAIRGDLHEIGDQHRRLERRLTILEGDTPDTPDPVPAPVHRRLLLACPCGRPVHAAPETLETLETHGASMLCAQCNHAERDALELELTILARQQDRG